MTQTLPHPEPTLVPVTPGQLPIVRDFLNTGDTPAEIARRMGVSRNLVSQQLHRVREAGGFDTLMQMKSAFVGRRALLVKAKPAPRGRHARRVG